MVGLETLYPENDLRELLVLDLGTRIREFRDLENDDLTHSELKRWAKWVAGVELTLERAVAIIAAGQSLLTAANLDPLLQALATAADKSQFRTFLRSL